MKAIDRVSVVQQTVDQIKALITSNELAVGQKLPTEKELCTQLAIGRGSLREALRVLAATGYVSLQPGRGAFVLCTEEQNCDKDVINWFETHEVQMKDYLEVRSVFEPLATKLAISHCTDEDYRKLESIHMKFVEAIDAGDFNQILLEEGHFHETIIKMSGNELLINIFKLMQQPMLTFRYRSLSLPNAPQEAIKPHAQILQAFDLHDPEYGEVCMRNHVNLGIKNLNISKQNYYKNDIDKLER
ncbi:MAG: FadR/GntR family transcriptional regulator [Angelakisella sp.]|nr:FadR/GntR family transcriptional regulator [Angelakisella sp.]